MQRSTRAWLALAILLAATAFVLRQRSGDPPQARAPLPEALATGLAPRPGTGPESSPESSESDDIDTSYIVPVEMRDLKAMADAGDPHAACRLGSLLAECSVFPPDLYSDRHLQSLLEQEQRESANGNLEAANQAAEMAMLVQTKQRYCRDLPDALLSDAAHYLRRAAMSGDMESRIRYVRGAPFRDIGLSNHHSITSPAFDRWRNEAPAMLQALLREGRPEAVLLLLEAHSEMGTPLSMITPADPLADQAYMALAQRLFEDLQLPEHWQAAPADPGQAVEAERLAARWHARYFEGRRYPMAGNTRGLSEAMLRSEHEFWVSEAGWEPACAPPGKAS